jgi:glycosyltransferase involved in cell wall biosynthesis
VVVPTFNRASLIGASLESVLAETGVDLEVIVVDDGSTDDTLTRLAAITDTRLRVLRVAHGGVAAARNAGVRVSAAHVAFHDSDDEAAADSRVPRRSSRSDPRAHHHERRDARWRRKVAPTSRGSSPR